jgi:hypothetical protein
LPAIWLAPEISGDISGTAIQAAAARSHRACSIL